MGADRQGISNHDIYYIESISPHVKGYQSL